MPLKTVPKTGGSRGAPGVLSISAGAASFLVLALLLANVHSDLWVVQVFHTGGPMMWPILICSVIALAICVERSVNLRRRVIIHPTFLKDVRAKWLKKEFDGALEICQAHPNSVSRIVRSGLLRSNMGILEIERAVEGAGAHESSLLNSNLRGLGVIANLAPMLGLLGTVAGMIKAFNVISQSGTGNPSLVASGISEALITTAAGLIVGIPTLAMYHFFRGRVEALIYEIEEISINFIEEISHALTRRDDDGGEDNEKRRPEGNG